MRSLEDALLRFLIGTACVVVIAAGGYYFWGEYRETARAAEIAKVTAEARDRIFRQAGAKINEPEKVATFCQNLRSGTIQADEGYLVELKLDCLVSRF
jgi:hypothetical protein